MSNFKQLRGVELKRFVRKNKIRQNATVDLIMLNLSYATNVASMFRSADAFGIDTVHLVGCTTTPPFSQKLKKVSRGKENSARWRYSETFESLCKKLQRDGFKIYALEIATDAIPLSKLQIAEGDKVALVVGNEEHGIPDKHLALVDECYFIPMSGKGKSLNVATTAAIGMYKVNSINPS